MQPLDPLHLPLSGKNLIEASAGTGKTFTLVLLYLRQLLEARLPVQNILVVTFTNAATNEMHARIQERLCQALACLDGSSAPDPLLEGLLQRVVATDGSKTARSLLQAALLNMDEAPVCTIHGFCQRTLTDFAFATGTPFAQDFLESDHDLRLEIIEDFWRQHFYPLSSKQAGWVASIFKDPLTLLSRLSPLLAHHDLVLRPEVNESAHHALLDQLQELFPKICRLWQARKEEIATLLRDDPGLKRGEKAYRLKDRLPALLEEMDRFTGDPELTWPPKDTLLFLLTTDGIHENLKKNKPAPDHPFFAVFQDFYSLLTTFLQQERVRLLRAAHASLTSELPRRKAARGQLAFDDLLTRLNASLDHPRYGQTLAHQLRTRYPAAMVDEFQDTDALQYQIFAKIYAGKRHSLTLIGDPKQAIYSFRGANIYTYLQARREVSPARQFSMDANYRSSAPMVEAVNTLFGRGTPFALQDIQARPLTAAANHGDDALALDGVSLPPLTALPLPTTDTSLLGKGEARRLAADICARHMAELLTPGNATLADRHLQSSDIAVLVRSHNEASCMQNALRRYGVASVLFSQETVYASWEAQQLFLTLNGLASPDTPAAVCTALATDLFAMDGNQLHTLHQAPHLWEKTLLTFRDYQQLWYEQGIFPLLLRLFADQQTVQRLSQRPSGDRALTNYLHLAELLENSEIHTGEALLNWFNRQLQDAERQGSERQLRLENDQRLVQIVTMHKAKGLQYPVVYLPFLWSCRKPQQSDLLIYHHNDEVIACLDHEDIEARELATRENRAEDMRLLYVALTRAEYACLFAWGPVSKSARTSMATLLGVDRDDVAPDQLLEVAQMGDLLGLASPGGTDGRHILFRDSAPAIVRAAKFTRSLRDNWRMTSYSRLAEMQDDDQTSLVPLPPAAQEQRKTPFTFPRGAESGTCLHTILERIDPQGSPESWEATVSDQLQRAGLDTGWSAMVCTWMDAVVHAPLGRGCCLAELQPGAQVQEMGFLLPLVQVDTVRFNQVLADHGHRTLQFTDPALTGMLAGFIDLVFHWQGRFYLADYKSNYLGPYPEAYENESLAQAMLDHRYDLQYLLYTLALHRYLGQRLPDYSYTTHFGDVHYLFLRAMSPDHPEGCGIFTARPAEELVLELNACIDERWQT